MLHGLYSDFLACEKSRENFNYSQGIVNWNKWKQREKKMAAAHSFHSLITIYLHDKHNRMIPRWSSTYRHSHTDSHCISVGIIGKCKILVEKRGEICSFQWWEMHKRICVHVHVHESSYILFRATEPKLLHSVRCCVEAFTPKHTPLLSVHTKSIHSIWWKLVENSWISKDYKHSKYKRSCRFNKNIILRNLNAIVIYPVFNRNIMEFIFEILKLFKCSDVSKKISD